MNRLQDYALYDISWNLSPEHAVTMYLEWGNNDWHSEYPPVRSKEDVSHYFVVDSWGKEPVIRLVRRNSENAEDLHRFTVDGGRHIAGVGKSIAIIGKKIEAGSVGLSPLEGADAVHLQ